MEKMRETIVVYCIVVACWVASYPVMAADHKYGGFGGMTHLVGRDGLCLDIGKQSAKGYAPTQLSPCEPARESQLWMMMTDGTIRTKDPKYCLVPYSDAPGAYAIIDDCYKWESSDKKWNRRNDGTVVHMNSKLVLTAKPGSYVTTLESDENIPSQSWEATEDLFPLVTNIKWLQNKCLQSLYPVPLVWLNDCNKDEKTQHWALLADGTIRVGDNIGYCLTSSTSNLILVSKCKDLSQQRWALNEEASTIYHPSTDLVMDVSGSTEISPIVVIDKRDGTPSQRWTIY